MFVGCMGGGGRRGGGRRGGGVVLGSYGFNVLLPALYSHGAIAFPCSSIWCSRRR